MEIKTVLCSLDLTQAIELELRVAEQLCQIFRAKLVLQHNLGTLPPSALGMSWMYSETHMQEEENEEATVERKMQEAFTRVPTSVQLEGKITHGQPDYALLCLAREIQADLIVLGTYDSKGTGRVALADRVLNSSLCPVLTIRDAETCKSLLDLFSGAATRQAVVVPVDFAPYSLCALEFALDLARRLPVFLHLLHMEMPIAWRDIRSMDFRLQDQRERRLGEAKDRMLGLIPADLSDQVKAHIRCGPATQGILRFADEEHAALILMGVHPKGTLTTWLAAPTVKQTLQHAPCPVWFVPATEQQSIPSSAPGTQKDISAGIDASN